MTDSRSSARRRTLHLLSASASAALLALGGCAGVSAPPAPRVVPPEAWYAGAAAATAPAAPADGRWWRAFGDPALDTLVETALRENADLRVAAARVAQARALANGADAGARPRLDVAGGAQEGRDTLADPRSGLLRGGFQASWEPDLFGRAALAGTAAARDAEGAELDRRAAAVAVAAEVATAYVEAAALGRRHQLARQSVDLLERRLLVARRRFEPGASTRPEIDRLEAECRLAGAEAIELERAQRVRLRQLALLVGAPRDLDAPAFAGMETAPIPAPAAVLPAELLERRPDVRRQASAVEAAAARLGLAKRDLYPRIEFDWAGSLQSLRPEGQPATRGLAIGYGVSLNLPVLDGGRIRTAIAVREAAAQEAMAAYDKAMLEALADAETALRGHAAAIAGEKSSLEAMRLDAAAARRTQALFDAGLATVDAVIDARRAALRTQDAWLQARMQEWASAIAVRRAFSGPV